MQTRHIHGRTTWIDVFRPTVEEVEALAAEFELHPVLCEELLTPSLRQKIDTYDNCFYAIFQFPVPAEDRTHITHEVDFVVGYNFIITVRYAALDPLHYFAKALDADIILGRTEDPHHAGDILWRMLRKLYESVSIGLSLLGEQIHDAEDSIYSGEERRMVRTLSLIRRDILIFHRALRHHKSMLSSLVDAANELYGADFEPWTKEIMSEYLKVEEKLDDRKETLAALVATNDSLLSAKTNISMYSLTILNTALLPAIVTAGILGMNTFSSTDVPEHGTLLALVLMFSISLTFFLILKWLTNRDIE